MNYLQAILIAIVEGLTEYLPVSSTAHMIFTSSFFGIQEDDFVKLFQVSIQFGAILAVVVLYWKKFFDFSKINFYIKLACAVVPALVLGKLFDDKIDAILGNPIPIAIVLILGGIILLFIDNQFKNPVIVKEEDITIKKAVTIGFWQCLAMMPGTSRSAASIIGGMQQGLDRQTAAEFSFFLAVPTMLAVTAYSLFLKTYEASQLKGYELLTQSSENMKMFFIGNIIAFIVAIIAIKSFIGIIKKYGFKPWGYYRIVAGLLLLVNKLKYLLINKVGLPKKFKIGHAGTLDPLATGLLLICTGKFTKKITELQGQAKEYTGTFYIGATTPSYDLETETDQTFPTSHIDEDLIHETVKQFLGEIDQKPPIFSAIKKDGVRLYEHARAGENIEISSRKTTIHEFEITRIALPEIDFRVVCSKGTYIRSLAFDFGKAMGSGSHLTALRRTKIGDYNVKNAIDITLFEEHLTQ
jgi:undecaprenyl-diphosphatase